MILITAANTEEVWALGQSLVHLRAASEILVYADFRAEERCAIAVSSCGGVVRNLSKWDSACIDRNFSSVVEEDDVPRIFAICPPPLAFWVRTTPFDFAFTPASRWLGRLRVWNSGLPVRCAPAGAPSWSSVPPPCSSLGVGMRA